MHLWDIRRTFLKEDGGEQPGGWMRFQMAQMGKGRKKSPVTVRCILIQIKENFL